MYVARPPLSTQRLSLSPDGNVLYELKRPFSDGRTHVLFSPVEFPEKLAALVPLPWFNQVKYNGVFAPNSPFRKEVVPAPEQDTPESGDEDQEKGRGSKYLWAILLKRVFNIDMTKCGLCGGPMRFSTTPAEMPLAVPAGFRNMKYPRNKRPQNPLDWY